MSSPLPPIRSRRNPRVQELKRLKKARERREQGRFLLEGPKFLASALEAEAPIQEVWIDQDQTDRLEVLLADLRSRSIPSILATAPVLEALASTSTPQGVVAVVRDHALPAIPCPQPGRDLLVLADLQDPGNLGTLWRTAAAAGVQALILGDRGADPTSPKVLRATAGVRFQVPYFRCRVDSQLVGTLHEMGYESVGLAASGEIPYTEVPFASSTAIWVGAEGPGLSPEILDEIPTQAWIPMVSGVESLNAAFAAGLLIYEGARRRGFPVRDRTPKARD